MKQYISLLTLALSITLPATSQSIHSTPAMVQKDQSVENRALELINKLEMKDEKKRQQAQALLTDHLQALETIFTDRSSAMKNAETNTADKELADGRARTAWDAANGKINKQYASFQGKLSTLVSQEQLEKLKDLMTEGGLQREYNNYLTLLPNLSDLQKLQLMAYLKEARENAMNAATPQNRVDWFIKFRGRANNYLAGAGYDLRKATEALDAKKNNSK